MTDHQWLDYTAPFALGALGALGAEERASFEAHLAECAVCRREVQSLREVAGLLAHAAPTVDPTPALRDRVLKEARRVRPISRPARVGVAWLAVAASLLLALAAGVNAWRGRAERGALRRSLDSARVALQAGESLLAARDSLLATVLAPDVGTASLVSKDRPPSIRLFWNRTRHVVVMAVFELPPAPAGRTYQLLGIEEGKAPLSLGMFNTAPDGRATLTFAVPPAIRPAVSAVTEEPAGGSPQPTQQPFLVGAWQGIE